MDDVLNGEIINKPDRIVFPQKILVTGTVSIK